MKRKVCFFLSLLLIFGIAVFFTSCDLSSLFNGNTSETGGGTSVPQGPVDPNDPPVNPPVVPPDASNQTPVAGDYIFGNVNQPEGNVTAVTITANSGKSPGAISNICYAGNTAVPQTAGTYAITFDVAAASGWNAASGIHGINLVVIAGGSQTPDGLIYSETASAVSIIGYIGTSTVVSIPVQINGKPVTAIGENAFIGKQLTSVA